MPKTKHPVESYFNRFSRYHYYCFTIMFFTKIPMYWHIMDLIFLSPPMKYECESKGNATKGACPCEAPKWDKSIFTKTMQIKFSIVCDRVWLISFSQSMLFVGTLVGSLLFGFMSDRFGRLTMFSIGCFGLGLSGCLVSLMPTAPAYIFMRCVEGVGIGGAIVTGYVLVVEYCGTRYRDTVTALYHIPLNIGHMTLAGVSYLLRDCDLFHLALSLPLFVCVLIKLMLFESPKWLMDSDQIDKAATAMQQIARFNGDKTTSTQEIKAKMDEYLATQATSVHKKISFWQIFRYKKLRSHLFCMAVIYFVCGMGYYGVSQYIGNMSGNIHVNVAISGLVLIPGTITTIFLLKLMSRKMFLIGTNLLSGLLMITVVCISSDLKMFKMVVACFGNTFFFMSFIIVFLYSVELFPTAVRNSVLGFLSVLARVGQIAAPPINALDNRAAGAIFGISAILGAAMCYSLPETKNIDLPSTLEDSEAIPKRSIRGTRTE